MSGIIRLRMHATRQYLSWLSHDIFENTYLDSDCIATAVSVHLGQVAAHHSPGRVVRLTL